MSDRKGFQGMSTFSTEFPVSAKISREQFIQVVVDWVAGIKASNLVGENVSRAAYDNEAELTGPGGERLSLKHVTLPSGFIAGARHSICDDEAREWRTEVVLSNRSALAIVKVRGQCLGATHGVQLQRPRKPFLIKKMLEEGWGGFDGALEVQASPHHFGDKDLELGAQLICGTAPTSLPVVYMSRASDGRLSRALTKSHVPDPVRDQLRSETVADQLLQPSATIHCPWRVVPRCGLLQQDRNRPADTGSSLNIPENCPISGG